MKLYNALNWDIKLFTDFWLGYEMLGLLKFDNILEKI